MTQPTDDIIVQVEAALRPNEAEIWEKLAPYHDLDECDLSARMPGDFFKLALGFMGLRTAVPALIAALREAQKDAEANRQSAIGINALRLASNRAKEKAESDLAQVQRQFDTQIKDGNEITRLESDLAQARKDAAELKETASSIMRSHEEQRVKASQAEADLMLARERIAEQDRIFADLRQNNKDVFHACDKRIAGLRRVLRPIAEVASDIPDNWSDDHQCVTECGHFRRARAALGEAEG